MAWRPWYERMAEMDSADEREEFLKGVFAPKPLGGKQAAGLAMIALLGGYGFSKDKKKSS